MKTERNFMVMLREKWAQNKSVCVGLDSDYRKVRERMPKIAGKSKTQTVTCFNKLIIAATSDLACAYKPNNAFYESYDRGVHSCLKRSIEYIHSLDQTIPVIWDAKRGDIDSTNAGYVDLMNGLDADAITIHPYMGEEANSPFLRNPNKGIIILCRTSNPGSGEFQLQVVVTSRNDLQELTQLMYHETEALAKKMGWKDVPGVSQGWYGIPMYQWVALSVRYKWNKLGNCLLVVGANHPTELAAVRTLVGEVPILAPGVGTQGGKVELVLADGLDQNGQGLIINNSREVIFCEPGSDIGAHARKKTLGLHDQIKNYIHDLKR